MKKLKLLPILGVTATAATLGSTLVACNSNSEVHFDYVLDKWAMVIGGTPRLIKENVNFEAKKEYKVKVDLSKFQDEITGYTQLSLPADSLDYVEWCRVFYDKQEIIPPRFSCQWQDGKLLCILNFNVDKTKDLYFWFFVNNKMENKTLAFSQIGE